MRLNLKTSLMGVYILRNERKMFFNWQVLNVSTNIVNSYGTSFWHLVGGIVPFKWEVELDKPLKVDLSSSNYEANLIFLLLLLENIATDTFFYFRHQFCIYVKLILGPNQSTLQPTINIHLVYVTSRCCYYILPLTSVSTLVLNNGEKRKVSMSNNITYFCPQVQNQAHDWVHKSLNDYVSKKYYDNPSIKS
jgi:hypothetical protein